MKPGNYQDGEPEDQNIDDPGKEPQSNDIDWQKQYLQNRPDDFLEERKDDACHN